MATLRDVVSAITSLNNKLNSVLAASSATAASLTPPAGGGPSSPGSLYRLIEEQIAGQEEVVKALKDNSKAGAEQTKRLEAFGTVVGALGPMLQQYVKYGITRPFEMLGGTAGAVGRGMLERERDAGANITGAVGGALGLISLVSSLNPLIGAGVLAFGQFGGNQLLGRGLFQKESLQGGAMQTIAQMTQQGVPEFRDAAKQQYGLQKLDVAMMGMGGGRGGATGMALSLTALGMSAPESQQLIASAVQAGGVQGFKRLKDAGGAEAIKDIVNAGIYGTDPTAIATAMAAGLRVGFTREMMEGASRRTGLQLPEIAQAATLARMQTYLAGPAAGTALFNMASNTQMARDVGMGATMGAITQAAAGAAGAAEGNEASSMLLYRQFVDANPGATYLDFVEARRNKETDPRWLKMIGGAARTFAGMGQTGRILGGALLGTRPMMVGGLATMMGQALGGGIGEISKETGEKAALQVGAQQMEAGVFLQTMATATKFQKEWGGEIERTTGAIAKATREGTTFTEMLLEMSKVMDTMSRSAMGIWWSERIDGNTGIYSDAMSGG